MSLVSEIEGEVINEENMLKNVINRFRKKDFSGNMGQAMKNSSYQLATNLTTKIGGLIFSIIIARTLLPEIFGLYSITISTILMLSIFSELGIDGAVIRFVAKELSKGKKNKSREYINYLFKIKLILTLAVVAFLVISAPIIADKIYKKPIYFALLSGTFFIIFLQLNSFANSILIAKNNFRGSFIKEIVFSISKIVFVATAALLGIKYSLSSEITLTLMISSISASMLISFLFLIYFIKKEGIAIKTKKKLTNKDKKEINKFILATSAIVLSGTFFANIDKIMMGSFIGSSFVGYYTVAVTLIASLTLFSSIFSASLLPIFSSLKKDELNTSFKKTIGAIFIISSIIFIAANVFSYLVILIVYGKEYLASVNILRTLSILVFINPIIGIYSSYFVSIGKPRVIARSTILATIINITLNFTFMTLSIRFGEIYVVYAAVLATLISQIIYMLQLILYKKKYD